MPANDIYMLRIKYQVGSIMCYNYLHFKALLSTSNASILTNTFAAAASADMSALRSSLHTSCRIVELYAVKINSGTPDTSKRPAASTLTGNLSGTMLPPVVVAAITLHTNVRGRRYRGRLYISGNVAERTSSGLWNTNAVTSYNSFITGLVSRYGPSGSNTGYRLGVWSHANGGYAPTANPIGWTQVIGGSINPIVTMHRKRQLMRDGDFPQPFME